MRTLHILLLFTALGFAAPKPLKTYELPRYKREQATLFHRRLNVLHFAGFAWDFAALAGIVALRIAPRVRDRLEGRHARLLVNAGTTAAILAIVWAVDLPIDCCRHWIGIDSGLSIQPWGSWFLDELKASAISGIVAMLLILAMLELARRSRRWWIWSWALSVIVIIAGTYLAPLVLDRLFFRFDPLQKSNASLVTALQKVASTAGYSIPGFGQIFQMDASTKTLAVNAYMTGFGNSRRIVIWDTTLKALSVPQIQTVFAHEAGHYKLNHIGQGIALGAVGLLIGFWLWDLLLSRFVRGSGHRFGVGRLHDPAIIPVAAILALAATFVSEPVVNSISRWVEHQADIFELEAMHGLTADAGLNSAETDQAMAEIDLDDPDPSPFEVFWLFDHPPTNERMRFAQTYDPWAAGKRPKYIVN